RSETPREAMSMTKPTTPDPVAHTARCDKDEPALSRRNILLAGTTLAAASAIGAATSPRSAQAQAPTAASGQKPNILVIWGDDVGIANVSAYSFGLMGYKTPNIDRIGREGLMFTDYYAEQSCTAGRASFLTGQSGLRTAMTTAGLPPPTLALHAPH